MRNDGILVVSAGKHPGVDYALNDLVKLGVVHSALHYELRNTHTENADELWAHLTELAKSINAAYVLLHHYNSSGLPDPRPWLGQLRELDPRPVLALSLGDAFYNGLFRPKYPTLLRRLAGEVDIVLNTSMGEAADLLMKHGAQRIALWPLSACSVRFPKPAQPYHADKAEFDVVFIGSNNRSMHPGHSYFWYSRERERMVHQLSKRFGRKFAVFGSGWGRLPTAMGMSSFSAQLDVCRRSRVVVGGVPYSPARYYLSNRPFIQILSGVPFVDLSVEGVDRILRRGDHWQLAEAIDEVAEVCDGLLSLPDSEREEMGREAANFIAENHMAGHRWKSLLITLEDLWGQVNRSSPSPTPDLRFFLPEVEHEQEIPLATRGFARPQVGRTEASRRRIPPG